MAQNHRLKKHNRETKLIDFTIFYTGVHKVLTETYFTEYKMHIRYVIIWYSDITDNKSLGNLQLLIKGDQEVIHCLLLLSGKLLTWHTWQTTPEGSDELHLHTPQLLYLLYCIALSIRVKLSGIFSQKHQPDKNHWPLKQTFNIHHVPNVSFIFNDFVSPNYVPHYEIRNITGKDR